MPVKKPEYKTGGKIPLLVLVGPTAVGKTALAVKIARKLNTDIISADSAQVYRLLDIGTAKPSPEEQCAARHHLIDLADPDGYFSVADYQLKAYKVIEQLWQDHKLPFMVGGTGLYIDAVLYRYAFGPKGPNRNFRKVYEQLALSEGLDKLYATLQKLDPEAAAKIHPNDRKRIIRALEVYALEGKPISQQVANTSKTGTPYQPILVGLDRDRTELYRIIERRIDLMIEAGWLDEVRELYRLGYDEKDPGLQVLGYRQLLSYLKGAAGWEETVEEIKKQTRNLAKRQLTWFRRYSDIKWHKITAETSFDHLTENICSKVQDLAPERANNNSSDC